MQLKEFVFFHQTYIHTGQRRLYSDWDFVTGMANNADAPKNWLEPVDYANGIYRFQVDVLEMTQVEKPVKIQFGWINTPGDPEIRHIASPGIPFIGPGKYELVGLVNALKAYYGAGDNKDKGCNVWHWDAAYRDNSMYTLINPLGNKTPFDSMPCKVCVKIIIQGIDKS